VSVVRDEHFHKNSYYLWNIFWASSFINSNTWHLICNNFNLNFIYDIVCLYVCVYTFSSHRESPIWFWEINSSFLRWFCHTARVARHSHARRSHRGPPHSLPPRGLASPPTPPCLPRRTALKASSSLTFSPTSPSSLPVSGAPPHPPPLDFFTEVGHRIPSAVSAVSTGFSTAFLFSSLPLPPPHIVVGPPPGPSPATTAIHCCWTPSSSCCRAAPPSPQPVGDPNASRVARRVAPSSLLLTLSTLPFGRLRWTRACVPAWAHSTVPVDMGHTCWFGLWAGPTVPDREPNSSPALCAGYFLFRIDLNFKKFN
jgi:hypothetical protein